MKVVLEVRRVEKGNWEVTLSANTKHIIAKNEPSRKAAMKVVDRMLGFVRDWDEAGETPWTALEVRVTKEWKVEPLKSQF